MPRVCLLKKRRALCPTYWLWKVSDFSPYSCINVCEGKIGTKCWLFSLEYEYVYGDNYCRRILNALISNQIARLCSTGIRATVLGVKHVVDEDTENSFECDFRLCDKEKLRSGYYHIVFSHPESFISCKYGRQLLKSKTYQDNICAIVIDEAHCILEW